MSEMIFTEQAAGYQMQLTLTRQSQDVLLTLTGGDVSHYGVVTAVGSDGLHTIALPSRPGHVHQEGVLTETIAKILQPVLPGNAMITGGMHVNNITSSQMHAAFAMTKQLGEQARDWLQQHPVATVHETFAN
ncbi:hypothetical protein [Lacticaseibacillus porcinae]|uniref:prenylated flavin chaperone LpdD n=1 Tax=Lacticaseibacillus porcinae TaxID=1123687 RepID=UPI000F766301|nr:hypothetical protein [Lacticaseibacillus porcinae]